MSTNTALFEDFFKLDIRVGEIVEANVFKEAKKPAYKLKLNFGSEIGIKQSSAQITELYTPEKLVGKQVLGVINFAPRQIANFISEVLILGVYSLQGVVLIRPEYKVKLGDKLG